MNLDAQVAAARPGLDDPVLRRALENAAMRLGAAPPRQLGRYRLDRVLGKGGFGTVWAATDPALARTVAIKILHREIGSSGITAMRVEAQALAALSHPNVVHVFDLGTADGVSYIVLEYIEGSDLATWLAEPRRASATRNVLADAAAGLAAAHGLGIVHRDVKPANILVDRRGRARVSDFGLARATAEPDTSPDASSQTASSSAAVGTPQYMAPEQHEGRSDSTAVDVFALAATAYEVLTGVVAFAATDPMALYGLKLEGRVSPAARGRRIPSDLHDALFAALDPDPTQRPTASELGAALRPRSRRSWPQFAIAGAAMAWFTLVPEPELDPCAELPWSAAASAGGEADAIGFIEDRAVALEGAWREVCGSFARGDRSRSSVDAARECLAQRHGQLVVLGEGLWAGNATAAEATAAISDLPDPATCLLGPSDDPASSAPEATLALARAAAANAVGDAATARREATIALGVADQVGSRRLQAHALLERGKGRDMLVDAEPALDDIERAYWLATSEGEERTAARAAIGMMLHVGRRRGDLASAAEWARHARAAVERDGDDPGLRVRYETSLSIVLAEGGDLVGGLAASERAQAVLAAAGLQGDVIAFDALLSRAMVLRQAGRIDDAAEAAGRAQSIARSFAGADSADSIMDLQARATMAAAWVDRGSAEQAVAELRAVAEGFERALGEHDERTHIHRGNLARVLLLLGEYALARDQLTAEYERLSKTLGPQHPRLARLATDLAVAHIKLGAPDLATAMLREAVSIFEANPPNPSAARAYLALAELDRQAGDDVHALSWLDRAVALGEATRSDDHPIMLRARALRALVRMETSNGADGLAEYEATRARMVEGGHHALAAEMDTSTALGVSR